MKKIIISAVSIITSIIMLTACGNDEKSAYTKEEEVIRNFYGAIKELNNKVTESYSSLQSLVNNVSDEVNAFEEIASTENLKHSEYFENVKSDPMYVKFKTEFVEAAMYDLDYPLTTLGYAIIIKTCTDPILSIEYPLSENDDVSVNSENVEFAIALESILDQGVSSGLNMIVEEDGNGLHAQPVNRTVYNTGVGNYRIYPQISYEGNRIILFDIQLLIDDLDGFVGNYNPTVACFSSDGLEIEVDSVHITNYESMWYAIRFYNSDWDSAMNEEYNSINEMFQKANNMEIKLGDELAVQLTEDDINLIKEYFKLMDIIIQIKENY